MMEDKEHKSSGGPGPLAEKLKELRLSHGYRQEDIAAAIDIRQASYSNYEVGRRVPSSLVLYRIANFYGMPVDDLLKLSLPLDDEIYFDAPDPSSAVADMDRFLTYMNGDREEKLSREEKELLYHFRSLTLADRQELVDYARFKAKRGRS